MNRFALTVLLLCSVFSKPLSPSFEGGYQAEYLGALYQQGVNVHLWKVVPSNSESDSLVKMAMHENEIVGFWIE